MKFFEVGALFLQDLEKNFWGLQRFFRVVVLGGLRI